MDQTDKTVIYWEREYSTALAPERLKLDFSPHRPLMSSMPLDEQRALAAGGYKVIRPNNSPWKDSNVNALPTEMTD